MSTNVKLKIGFKSACFVCLVCATLIGCGGDNDNGEPPTAETPTPSPTPSITPEPELALYRLSLLNATNNQPFSPAAVYVTSGAQAAWEIGSEASNSLERLAESGDASEWLNAANTGMRLAYFHAEDALLPGSELAFDLEVDPQQPAYLHVATMLVNTNDAFAGITSWPLSNLEVGQARVLWLPVYDAGTESNSETSTSIPGPAAGGEGFNIAREEGGIVTRHPGVVTSSDGYADSALDESHRFEGMVGRLRVTRVM